MRSPRLQAVHNERATALYGVPTMFVAELEHPEFDRFDLTSLRKGVMSGAPCPIELMKRAAEKMHIERMVIPYGQTETSPVITMSRVDDPFDLRVDHDRRGAGQYRSADHQPRDEGAPADRAAGRIVHARVPGDEGLRRRSRRRPRRSSTATAGCDTGDLAVMHANGYFSFKGRAKDTIIRGGENIYPREVEDFLHTHPKIADVYVVGIPDAKLGETVLAWVQLKSGEEATAEEIRDFCRGKIAYFKIPQYVRFVDSFPMTVSKKVQKFLMREQEIRERGLEEVANRPTA